MDIKPFRGYRYNPEVVGNAGLCIAPPYDVIDPEQQEELYKRHKSNIVRVIKGKQQAGEGDEIYRRAGRSLQELIATGALQRDPTENIYVYSQDFNISGQSYQRSGFIALGKLEDYGGAVKAHEHTLAGPKADRLRLMRATRSQIGQIFVLYNDPEQAIDKLLQQAITGEALLDYHDEEGVRHRLFSISDPGQCEQIQQVMSERDIFIADGHHRYETALNYYRETGDPNAAYRMMTFVNTHNRGLVVLPTHRLIKNIADFQVSALLEQMRRYFDVARLSFTDVVEKGKRRKTMLEAIKLEWKNGLHAFGMYFADGAFYIATLRDETVMNEIAPESSAAWRSLDVVILHKLILEQMLGIDSAALSEQSNVEYIKDFGDATSKALDRIDSGQMQGMFFLNPTPPETVAVIAGNGEKMPQKSTFFYPKVFSGLVLNILPPEYTRCV